ncbi:hypothetical protein NP493_455g01003 [Ridgeia piscesae]|uniref:EGF-like domain-containing protein n=1 Tax=Ridgeia piscesae TaxID=27915 RepID=A0AAD9L0J4_RIDPI|nr:hypothetical protein NP493_455g01003 [Ridgeia piscesae]
MNSQCECESGYQGDGEKCVDINECETKGMTSYECHVNADCTNYPGGYSCRCQAGFRGDGKYCTDNVSSVADIDECMEKRHDCSQFAECRNTVGGFQCACNAGFHGDGWDCLREYGCLGYRNTYC